MCVDAQSQEPNSSKLYENIYIFIQLIWKGKYQQRNCGAPKHAGTKNTISSSSKAFWWECAVFWINIPALFRFRIIFSANFANVLYTKSNVTKTRRFSERAFSIRIIRTHITFIGWLPSDVVDFRQLCALAAKLFRPGFFETFSLFPERLICSRESNTITLILPKKK